MALLRTKLVALAGDGATKLDAANQERPRPIRLNPGMPYRVFHMIALEILGCVSRGERDPDRIRTCARSALHLP